jgi:hypothetical protein
VEDSAARIVSDRAGCVTREAKLAVIKRCVVSDDVARRPLHAGSER